MMGSRKWLYLLAVFCCFTVTGAETNLALGKSASQSSDHRGYTAGIAVNGRTDDFTHTHVEIGQWWTVDLRDIYHVTRIKLFNRLSSMCQFCDRLQQIYILTSRDINPRPPSTGGYWEVRSYRGKPYGEVGTIILESNNPVRHIAVYSLHRAPLSLAEVQVFALDYNLAYNKTAVQQVPYRSSGGYSASLAVDGRLYDGTVNSIELTHTRDEADQYWRVDLGEVYDVKWIELYNRNQFGERLSEITIWGTDKLIISSALRFAGSWEKLHYQKDPYGAVGVLILDRVHRFRNIAVAKDGVISLKEVQVFSRKRTNYAIGKITYQISNYVMADQYEAANAVNGELDKISVTGESIAGEWWKVDLGKRIIFQYARIFARDDDCGGYPCYLRLNKTSYLTNSDPHDLSKPPTKQGSTWKKCFYSGAAQGVEFTVVCEGNLSPYIHQFAILTDNNQGVALREVEIYGYSHVPTFTRQQGAVITRPTDKQVVIAFDQWNIDDMPWINNLFSNVNSSQIEYVISLAGERSQNIAFSTAGRVQFSWSGLNPYITYRFLVSCQIAKKSCPSPFTSILAPAKKCTAPDPSSDISFTHTVFEDKGTKRLRYTAEWKAPPNINCLRLKRYQYQFRYGFRYGSVQFSSVPVVRFDAEPGGITITITVWVINDADMLSVKKIKSISTPDLKSEAPKDIKLTPTSPYSVLLSWKNATNTYGKVLTYQYKCTNKGWINQTDSPVTVDGYSTYSLVSCKVRVINRADVPESAGDTADSACVRTLCADSQVERRLDFDAHYDIPCSILNDSLTSKLILSTARQNYQHVKVLCNGLCTVTDNSSPILSCQNNRLAITWPTETAYRADVTTIPQDVADKITEGLNKAFFPIVIISRVPPIVYPLANNDGTPARIGLKSQCVTVDGSVYNEMKDICEKRSF